MPAKKAPKSAPKKAATLETAAPGVAQVAKIEEIEGIGKEYAKDLNKFGIKTTEDLRKASLVEVVEKTGISPKLVFKFQCVSDLFRLKRVASEWSDLLFEMGIETVKEVSKQNANDLFNNVKKFAENAKKKPGWQGDVNKLPTQDDVKKWIESAKELVKLAK